MGNSRPSTSGVIYEGYNILPYSPALATPLSNFEVNLGGYQDVVDQAITVRFKIDGAEDTYFLAWTTTPWTLPSNLALALGPDIEYVKVKDLREQVFYILGKDRLGAYYKDPATYEIVATYRGTELAGMRYEPLFPFFAHLKETGAFVTVVGDHVTVEDGCGIVHTASGFGEDDYQVLKGTGIPVVCPIDDDCKFTAEVPLWEGVFVKDADSGIITWLKGTASSERENTCKLSVLSGSQALIIVHGFWYVMCKTQGSMLAAMTKTLDPAHLKNDVSASGRGRRIGRSAATFGLIRTGLECDGSDYLEVIGSIEELQEKSGVRVTDLHKHFVDDITWPSPDGTGTMRRIPDVLDCWFESGSMPYAQNHYPFENKEFVEEHFPADFICEGLDQTRGWFYTLVIIGAALFDKPAFYNCVTNGIVLTADGKKMSSP